MNRHHGRCGPMHGMMNDEEMMHMKMRCHGMGHGHGMGPGHGMDNDPTMRGRHFFTKDEKMEMLLKYKEWLEKESKGVEELIEKMK